MDADIDMSTDTARTLLAWCRNRLLRSASRARTLHHGRKPSRACSLRHCLPALLCAWASLALAAFSLPAHAQTAAPAAAASAPGSASYASAGQRVLVVGDSLSAEYGLERGTGWVALLDKRLAADGLNAAVANASISGDTTAGGLARLPALLKRYKPTLVVIELGGNDALRGLSLQGTQSNLVAMTRQAKAVGARVLLVGMQIPPNYGRKFADDFAAVYTKVAQQEQVPLVPFLLKGVADGAEAASMFQADRIHPLASAHPTMLENVWAVLGPMLAPSTKNRARR